MENRTIELYPGEGNQVGSIPIPKFLDIMMITENEKQAKLGFVIDEITGFKEGENYIYFNSFGLAGNRLVFFRTSLLTAKGREFLNYHQKLRNLFPTLHDKFAKEIILEEYK